ncbi:MAG: hypothetical protein M3291_09810 [Actinomycetota bacterium]|nr:hypothetical protein [Actinomycetota bacterium]
MTLATRGALVGIAALFGVGLAVLGFTHSLSGGSDPVQAPPTEADGRVRDRHLERRAARTPRCACSRAGTGT